jgi:hypothetical protein
VKHKLSEALTFMTGDWDFTFIFQSGHCTPATSLFDRGDFRIEPHQRTSIVLFSGGLDSLAGAIERLETCNDQVCLVSHRSQPGTIRTQDGLVQALGQQPRYKSRISHYPQHCLLQSYVPKSRQRDALWHLFSVYRSAFGRVLL